MNESKAQRPLLGRKRNGRFRAPPWLGRTASPGGRRAWRNEDRLACRAALVMHGPYVFGAQSRHLRHPNRVSIDDGEALSGLWRAYRFAAFGFSARHDLALERTTGRSEHGSSFASHVLVRAAIAADVFSDPRHAATRSIVLAGAHRRLRTDGSAVCVANVDRTTVRFAALRVLL